MRMRTTVGLEIHAQLLTKTKLFCSCSADYFEKEPNTNTCPVCLGMPGALPVLNEQAVDYALRAALALNCRIPKRSKFDRKNYFYPDLPKGYQISQYDEPLAYGGWLEIGVDSKPKKIRIRRVHLEEDAGKLIHTEEGTWVDFNRSGVPLIEIVTEPDISSPKEAAIFMKELRRLLRYLEVCDGNMEQGSLRCDANISVGMEGELGVKTEVKNLNSFKAVEEALRLEEERQREVLAKGGKIKQQTLGWDAEALVVMRTKEEAEDYRYFPEPDLVPLEINEEWKLKVKKAMPELPKERQLRWKREYELPDYDIKVLCEEKHIADYFEAVVKKFEKPKEVSNWMMSELLRLVKEDELVFERLRPAWFAQILRMVEEGKINRSTGKELIEESLKTGRSPQEIVKERSLIQITDEASLLPIVEEVIASNPQAVADFKSGNHKVLGFLIGQVMRETKGKANPKKTGEILKKLITP